MTRIALMNADRSVWRWSIVHPGQTRKERKEREEGKKQQENTLVEKGSFLNFDSVQDRSCLTPEKIRDDQFNPRKVGPLARPICVR